MSQSVVIFWRPRRICDAPMVVAPIAVKRKQRLEACCSRCGSRGMWHATALALASALWQPHSATCQTVRQVRSAKSRKRWSRQIRTIIAQLSNYNLESDMVVVATAFELVATAFASFTGFESPPPTPTLHLHLPGRRAEDSHECLNERVHKADYKTRVARRALALTGSLGSGCM